MEKNAIQLSREYLNMDEKLKSSFHVYVGRDFF